MSKVCYVVAMSLDGFIAGPNGEADWIMMDPEIDFGELWAKFDTLLMGRKTFEAAVARLGRSRLRNMKVIVVSRTLRAEDHPDLTIVSNLDRERMKAIRAGAQKDVWLMGGGELFSSLLELHEVDTAEVSVMPVLLGNGVRLAALEARRTQLGFLEHRVYPHSGIVSLAYRLQL